MQRSGGRDRCHGARTPASTSRSTCRCRCWRCSTRTTSRSSSPTSRPVVSIPTAPTRTFCEDGHVHDRHLRQRARGARGRRQICAESKTPPGVFRLKRYEDGQHVSPLGGMKNPWYFNYGIAIHGAQNVPDHPASHGCVRMSNGLADVFPTLVEKGNAVYVWGYDGREPEGYTERRVDAVVQPPRSGRHDDHDDRRRRSRRRRSLRPPRLPPRRRRPLRRPPPRPRPRPHRRRLRPRPPLRRPPSPPSPDPGPSPGPALAMSGIPACGRCRSSLGAARCCDERNPRMRCSRSSLGWDTVRGRPVRSAPSLVFSGSVVRLGVGQRPMLSSMNWLVTMSSAVTPSFGGLPWAV